MSRSSLVHPELAANETVTDDGEVVNVNSKGKRQNVFGMELPDPTPVAPPVGYNRQPSLSEKIRAMVRSEALRAEAEKAGVETFEEADDFDIPDDDQLDPHSQWENEFDVPVTALREREQAERDANASFPPAITETKLEPNNDGTGLGVRPAIPTPAIKVDGTHT